MVDKARTADLIAEALANVFALEAGGEWGMMHQNLCLLQTLVADILCDNQAQRDDFIALIDSYETAARVEK